VSVAERLSRSMGRTGWPDLVVRGAEDVDGAVSGTAAAARARTAAGCRGRTAGAAGGAAVAGAAGVRAAATGAAAAARAAAVGGAPGGVGPRMSVKRNSRRRGVEEAGGTRAEAAV
jgi:hypothetical protein